MSVKKVTPIQLFLQDLKKTNFDSSYLTLKIARDKFQRLSVKDKDVYNVRASKFNNSQKPKTPKYTTQCDTLGFSMKEVEDMQSRIRDWAKSSDVTIKQICQRADLLDRNFFIAQVSGVDFNCLRNDEALFAASEIYITKFNFNQGIVGEMVVFPNPPDVPIGHREKLFEDLEECVGYRPDTFKHHHQLTEVYERIESFIGNVKEPIFVATLEHQKLVGMALYTVYKSGNRQCPWIDSFQDWGRKCNIHKFENLIFSVLSKHSKETMTTSEIIRQWQRMKLDISPEPCDRHLDHGLYHQCGRNVLRKYLFCSLIIVNSIINPDCDLQKLISKTFYDKLSYIMPPEKEDNGYDKNKIKKKPIDDIPKSDWSSYYIDERNLEDMVRGIRQMSIKEKENQKADIQTAAYSVTGRGSARTKKPNSSIQPKFNNSNKKLKLPFVIC